MRVLLVKLSSLGDLVHTFPALTDAVHARPDLEIYNMGVSGYGTDQELLLLQRFIARYRPALVVAVYTNINDPEDNGAPITNGGYPKPYYRLEDGALRLHGVPLRWRTEITAWEPPHRFVDEQVRGPYRRWVHEHTFRPQGGGTLVTDHVAYRVPGWVLEPLVHRLLVGPDLRTIFAYRRERLTELLGRGGAPK